MDRNTLEALLGKCWKRETSAGPEGWTGENPAWGQCAVTALVVQDFGGDKTLNLVFNQPNMTIEKASGGLLSYYNDLYSQSNRLLLPL